MAQSIEHRFGPDARRAPGRIEWLSDNAPCYTAHETREFGESVGMVICTTMRPREKNRGPMVGGAHLIVRRTSADNAMIAGHGAARAGELQPEPARRARRAAQPTQ